MSTELYKCDKCGATFKNRNLAEKCEFNHVEVEFIFPVGADENDFCVECLFDEGLEYPSELVVKKNENIQVIYKLTTTY